MLSLELRELYALAHRYFGSMWAVVGRTESASFV